MEVLANSETPLELKDYLINADNFDLDKIKQGAILLFDKPELWSSFKLVKKVRYLSKAAKVGHAGTLDPLATGLLIICTGKCTKMIEKIQDMEKTYTGVFNFGKTTPSHDLETEFDGEFLYEHIQETDIDAAVQAFTGDVAQTPPSFSAIKVNGVRAYKMARNGEEVEMKSRFIKIYGFKVDKQLPDMQFEVNCSKGTYIRTLASDFASHLKSGAYLTQLRRTAIGDFNIKDAFSIENFEQLCSR
jgi:tRNA pseudouridine55 synthase